MSLGEHAHTPETVKQSSDRTFGLVFAGFFALVAVLPMFRGRGMRGWAAIASGIFLLVALTIPKILAPLNRIWTMLGAALHRVTNPLVMGVFFYGIFTPFGWLLRVVGKDFLRLRYAPDAESYWIPRAPAPAAPQSMKNQF